MVLIDSSSSDDMDLDSETNVRDGIWNATVPRRCKNLAWSACNDELPVRSPLLDDIDDDVVKDVTCPICRTGIETTVHAFLLCEEAKRAWFASPLGLRVDKLRNMDTIVEWMEHCVDVLDRDAMGMVCAVMWALWHRRNAWVNHRRKMDCGQVLAKAKSVFAVMPVGPNEWVPPTKPYLKANFAAAVRADAGTAISIVLRDSFALPKASATNLLEDRYYEPQVAEALSFRWALEQSGDLGFSDIVFETSCQQFYTQWNQITTQGTTNDPFSYLNSVLQECRSMIRGTGSTLRLVRPSANKVAQCLAKLGFDYGQKVWMGLVPEEALGLVEIDLANSLSS